MSLQRSTLFKYAQLLANCTRARLVGTRGAEEVFNLQVLDCEPSVEFLPPSGKVIDVGSGGGLPGIVWAVYRPDLEIILLDSVNKKCEATSEIIRELEIKNVNVVCSRSEDFAKLHREEFDLAASRAVASAGITAELLSPLVKVGGKILTFKGEKVHDEISEVENKWQKLGLSKPSLNFYGKQEDENSSKCLLTWEKISPCPKEFPRRTGLAATKKFWEKNI
ncbi:MAG: 16S rRNA (guanine(527)-N(7))-methyltransferase RsmG [Synergistaceae bacterium]|nr:16S rRNA (guanine(527)-N(7))-methyltransferase RsmG [Synergistaceae bacterium]